jgi:hypothetical protein
MGDEISIFRIKFLNIFSVYRMMYTYTEILSFLYFQVLICIILTLSCIILQNLLSQLTAAESVINHLKLPFLRFIKKSGHTMMLERVFSLSNFWKKRGITYIPVHCKQRSEI